MDRPKVLQPPLDSALSDAINEKWALAQELRDKTLESASEAIRAALDCGDLLIRKKSQSRGNFELWLRAYCPKMAQSEAKAYMTMAKLRREVGDDPIDSQLVWQFYHGCGLLPPRAPTERNPSGQILQFWSFCGKIKNWLPSIPEEQKPRIRQWWENIGKMQGWL